MTSKRKDVFVLCEGKPEKILDGKRCRPPSCRCLQAAFSCEGEFVGVTLTDPDYPNVKIQVAKTYPFQAMEELVQMAQKIIDKRDDLAILYTEEGRGK